jgi:hypothetical protein
MGALIDLSVFGALPDESRLWVHGFREPLTPIAARLVNSRLEAFTTTWVSHGKPVTSASLLVEERFLLTSAWCSGGMSGCSVDSYFRVLKELRDGHGLDPLDTGLVFYRDGGGTIRSCPHLDFYHLVETGVVRLETPVFDTLIGTLGALRARGMEVPYGDSWHRRTYGEPGAACPVSAVSATGV